MNNTSTNRVTRLKNDKSLRVLYVTAAGTTVMNGNLQRQLQLLRELVGMYGDSVNVLSADGGPSEFGAWLREAGLNASVVRGLYAHCARVNTRAWYAGNVAVCNKLKLTKYFGFPLRTPLPSRWLESYNLIVCFYPWLYRLLGLERAAAKVVVDLNDVMADRHHRVGDRRWISLSPSDEKYVLTAGSRCVAISSGDAKEFQRLYGVRLPIAPYIPADSSDLIALSEKHPGMRAGFIGAPNYLNEQVLRLLAEPELLKLLSGAGMELVIAGGICDSAPYELIRRLKDGGAKVLGRIASIADFFSSIRVMLNPVGPSTGVKVKSVESLLAGRQLVTTPYGVDELLCRAFEGQITCLDWPITVKALADATIEACSRAPLGRTNADVYINRTHQAMRVALSLPRELPQP